MNCCSYTEVLACNPLTIGNGVVTYSQAVFTAGTIANYSCNTGYALSQVLSVTCVINILSRVTFWNPGNRPICIREFLIVQRSVIFICCRNI